MLIITVIRDTLITYYELIRSCCCCLYDRKAILQDMVKYSDFTTDKFQEVHLRMQEAVDSVKPVEEYRDFVGKHR